MSKRPTPPPPPSHPPLPPTLYGSPSGNEDYLPISSCQETIAFAARKIGKRFGMGKEIILHIDPDGTLRIEKLNGKDRSHRQDIVIPANSLESAVVKGNLRLCLTYLETQGVEATNTPLEAMQSTKRLLEFDTQLHREQFVAVLQSRVSGKDDPEDISTAASRHLKLRSASVVSTSLSRKSYASPSSSLCSDKSTFSPSTGASRSRHSIASSTPTSMNSILSSASGHSLVGKRPSLVWTPGGMDTLHDGQMSPYSIEKSKGDGHHGGGLLRAATSPSISNLMRMQYDKVHLFGRLYFRKDLKTSHFGGNWKRRWCMLMGTNILIFKTEEAGVAFADCVSSTRNRTELEGARPQDHAFRNVPRPHQIVELSECEKIERSGSLENMRFTFKLILPGRLPIIAATSSESELDSWVNTLEALLSGEDHPSESVHHSLIFRGNVHIRKSGSMYHLGFNWKQRHMMLDGHHIVVTKTDDPGDPVRRELRLLSSSRCGPLDTERPHTFVLINFEPVIGDSQPLMVSAVDDEKMEQWTNLVQQAIQSIAWKEEQQNRRGPDAGVAALTKREDSSNARTLSKFKAQQGDNIGVLSSAAARAMERALIEAQQTKEELKTQVAKLSSSLQQTKLELGRAHRWHSNVSTDHGGRPKLAVAQQNAHRLPVENSSSSNSKEILSLRAQVKALTQQLQSNQLRTHNIDGGGHDDGWDGSLESAVERLTAAATRLQNGDESAQGDFDKWDKIVAGHPEHKAKIAAADLAWENTAAPKCEAALQLMRTFVPSCIFSMKKADLGAAGVSPPLIRRLFSKKVLHFLRMETTDIAKIHIVDLRNRYASQGLDIVEMRAIYKVLPVKFDNDSDGAKLRWRKDFRNRLMRLTKMEESGTLRGNALRHSAYKSEASKDRAAAGLYSSDPRLRKVGAIACDKNKVNIKSAAGVKMQQKKYHGGKPGLPFEAGMLAAALEKKKKTGSLNLNRKNHRKMEGNVGRGPNPLAAVLEAKFAQQRAQET